jgi:excisionase family DNA binding protein
MTPCFLDIREAAEFLKIKVTTLYDWVHQRRIPFRKHGRRLVFATEDLRVWSEGQAVGIRPEIPLGIGSLKTRRTVEARSTLPSKEA